MKSIVVLLALSLSVVGQCPSGFGPQQVITTNADHAESVYATDLDGDGDTDVLSASAHDDKIAWYENMGNGVFGTEQVITTRAFRAYDVYAIDLDGDGDADVLSASVDDDKIAWYENLGSGDFGYDPNDPAANQQVITTIADSANTVYATDLDGDGDADVLSASFNDNKIAWYKNLGSGDFGYDPNDPAANQQVITTSANGARSVYATDINGDGDVDVLSASMNDNKIAWYKNLGTNPVTFVPQQPITTSAAQAADVYSTDLDGDGDVDVLSASRLDDKIAWYENLGLNTGTFVLQQVLNGGVGSPTSAQSANTVYALDLDGDGDNDVLSASDGDDKIAWYENLGGGTFDTQQVISTNADGAWRIHATDLDGDGDADVLSASNFDNKIAWYENQITPPCPSGACLDIIPNATIGNPFTILLQSPAANSACYVLLDTQTGAVPLGIYGSSQIAFSPSIITLADATNTFGTSLTFPYTDGNGEWAFAATLPNVPALVGFTLYGEAYVIDPFPPPPAPTPPNGVFWQSNLLTITIQ